MDRKHNMFEGGFMLLFYYKEIRNVNIRFFGMFLSFWKSLE